MPIFEFECPKCLRAVEEIQKLSDPPPVCPHEDEQVVMKKKLSAKTGFILRGQGWYATDYKGKK